MSRKQTKPREVWVDVAKGLAISLVVVFHTQQLLRDSGFPVDDFWLIVANTFTSVRMPAFFMISGFFLQRWAKRGWPKFLRGKVYNFVYLYVIWCLVYFLVDRLIVLQMDPHVHALIRSDPHAHAVRIATPLWYLLALPLFALLWYITRKLPAWIPLAATAVGYVGIQWGVIVLPEPISTVGIIGFVHYAFAFMVGARLSEPIRSFIGRARGWYIVPFAGAWFALILINPPIPGLQFFVSVPTLFLIAKMITRSEKLTKPLLLVGKRSLPIYVTHWLLLEVQLGILYAVFGPLDASTGVITTPILSATSILISCTIWRLTRHSRVLWGTARIALPERRREAVPAYEPARVPVAQMRDAS